MQRTFTVPWHAIRSPSIPVGYRCPTQTMLVRDPAAGILAVMSERTIALVTGANQGIGYEIAAGLGALGWSIGVGDRNPELQHDAVANYAPTVRMRSWCPST